MKNGMMTEYDGTKAWYLNDELHREDGPALEYPDGNCRWYLNGKLHRVDGPAVEWADGSNDWFLNGKQHRVDGPAIEFANGDKSWFLNGECHREDGPAVEWADGSSNWYVNGKHLRPPNGFSTMEEWFQRLNNDEEYSYQYINDIEGLISFIDNPTDKQKRLHQMKWIL